LSGVLSPDKGTVPLANEFLNGFQLFFPLTHDNFLVECSPVDGRIPAIKKGSRLTNTCFLRYLYEWNEV